MTFTNTLSAYTSQHGNIVDGFVVVCFVAAALWVADKACNKLFPVSHYDDDDEDFEEFWNGLEHLEEEEEEEEYEEELFDGCEKKVCKKLEKSIVPCMQSRVQFADIDKVRVYTLPKGPTMRHIDSQTNQISRNWCPTRALLGTWIALHHRNVFVVEPMDVDGPEDLIQGPVKPLNIQTTADARSTKRRRTDSGRPRVPLAPSCDGASAFKRLKMTIPSSTKEWVQVVDSMHTPTMPVLIEELRNDKGSSISAMDQNSNDSEDDDDELSLYSAFDDDDEDGFGDENDTAPTVSHSPIAETDYDDELSLFSAFDDDEDDFGDENDTAPTVSHSPIAEMDDDDDDLSLFSAFDDEEDDFGDENDTAPTVHHSPITGINNDSIEHEVSLQGTTNDQAVPPAESAGSIEANSTAPTELGSGWTESGKRYSLRLAKHNADDEPSLGSGMAKDGRRFSRRVASRQRTSAY